MMTRNEQKAMERLERVCDLLFNHPQRDEHDEAAIDLIQQSISLRYHA
jgi:hypothetical protein